MEEQEFKCIVGNIAEKKPAVIRFSGPVTAESASCFNNEFLYLQDYVNPSRIVVMINSEGGSVLAGMSVFSVIQSCPIETCCVVEGLAASMGSVIWAAGSKLYMHDYSLLMIHNPFFSSKTTTEDATVNNMMKAFKGQIETVYCKRFGLSKAEVRAIMDGEDGADGTYMSASDAVKSGILPKKNVIRTSEQVRADIGERIKNAEGVASVRDIMASAFDADGENKLINKALAILEQNLQNNNTQQVMNEKELAFNSVVAQLGLSKETSVTSAPSRVAELMKAEAKLKTLETDYENVKAELDQLKIQHKGKEAEATNLSKELAEVKNELQTYKQAEAAEKAKHIETVVDEAITAGKIPAEDKTEWVEMAQANLQMVEKTLGGIAPREVISEEISNDPANMQAAEDATKGAYAELAEKVRSVVGDLKLKKF